VTFREEVVVLSAGIAAGHPATADAGLSILAAGGTAADAAVAAVLASCVAETVLTGLAGGGFATYYEAATGTVSCLDFFVAMPGLDGDAKPGPMTPVEVTLGAVAIPYSIGGPTVAVPGVPAGCGALHRRWGRLPWETVVAPAVELARRGAPIPHAMAHTLRALAPAMVLSDGGPAYAPGGKLLDGGDLLRHPGLDRALRLLADEGPDVFYTGKIAEAIVTAVRAGDGALGPEDLAAYRVLELPVGHGRFAGAHVYGRDADLNSTVATIDALGDAVVTAERAHRAVLVANALRDHARQRLGDTTNVSVVDPDGNACVATTTLGLGAGVWLPGLGVHLNSMLGEGELLTGELPPGARMDSYMSPLVVTATPATPTRSPGAGPADTDPWYGDEPATHRFDGEPAALPSDTPVDVHTAGDPHPHHSSTVAELAADLMDVPPEPSHGGLATGGTTRGDLVLAVGAAGASRIRTALVHTMLGVLVDHQDPETAIGQGRFHVVEQTVHAEPGVPEDQLAALVDAGYSVHRWPTLDHYFGGASAVGPTGAGGDPRRGGIGMHL
jgi:gamma-glutamyltranspeptidase/glutathione hydrolase